MKIYGPVRHDLRTLFESGALGGLSDGELLACFIARRDEAAFEALVRRHGAMVLGVCRRLLRDHHDAEDAFQATFLVLARKAESIHPPEMLPNWLHGVAHQVAVKAHATRARRRSRERQVTTMPEPATVPDDCRTELSGLLDEEVSRLPAKYRVPVVLCELEGLGHKEAAIRLGWPVGTLSGRLSRARALLARRLTRRGLVLSAGALSMALSQEAATAGVPAPLLRLTIESAITFATGPAATGAISGRVAALSRQVLGDIMMTKLITTTGVCLAGGALLFGGAVGHRVLAGHGHRGVIRPVARPVALAEDAAVKEAKLLEGTWQGVELEMDGKRIAGFEARDRLVVFEGEEITMKSVNGPNRGRPFKFKLDPGKSPKAIDITMLDGRESGQTAACIYALEKARLMICIPSMTPGNDPRRRPTEFRTRDGDGLFLFVLERVGPKGPIDPGPRDPTLAGIEVIQRDFERAELAFWDAYGQAKTTDGRRKVEALQQTKIEAFAERFLKLAQERPNTREDLFALCWAAVCAPASEPGKKALAILEGGRLAGSDPGDLLRALQAARTSQGSRPSPLAPLVLQRAEADLEHPAAAALLTWVCGNDYGSEWPEESRTFAEAANLIAARFPDSPDIYNFCECLSTVDGRSPAWAIKYERHLRTIVARNGDRWVLCTAMSALATVVKNGGQARRDEAEALYESLIKRFEDLSDPKTKGVEAMMIAQARRSLKAIRDRKQDPAAKATKS